MAKKPRIAVYDFTDCEGCEVRLCSLGPRLLDLERRFDLVNWRLGQDAFEDGPYDAAFIEGTPVTRDEVAVLKELRRKSKILVTLGACASIAGIPGILDFSERKKWYKEIYGPEYKPKGVDALPVSAYVPVDHSIHGCPVDGDELLRTIEEIAVGKKPGYRPYSVCFDCKRAGNPCRILNEKICFGPITQGGCKAVCVSGGSPCYGCLGPRDGAAIPALVRALRRFATPKAIREHMRMFFNRVAEYRKAFERALRKKSRASA
jgi:coenzyme F420-reducing hydrogenase gamma subunit